MMSDEVVTIIRSIKQHDGHDIDEKTYLIDSLGFTSLDVMNLILALEQRFKITFNDEDLDLDRFVTVGAVLETLKGYDVGVQ